MSIKRRVKRLEGAGSPGGDGVEESGSAEPLYLKELEWHAAGESHLVHDENTQTFYTPSGEFALSRHRLGARAWFEG